jgi:hypothetical protein
MQIDMDKKKTELSQDALNLIEAATPNVKNGVYLYDRFKTLDDIRNRESWDEFWNSDNSPFPREEWRTKELAEVFNKGWIKLEPLPENGTTIVIDESVQSWARSGGGNHHAKLKALAAMWLMSQGEENIGFECRISGRVADVYGKDLRCWIECGNTTADKIMDSLFDARCNSFVVFPFVFHDMIEGYRFTTTIDKETIERWERDRLFKNNPTKGLL